MNGPRPVPSETYREAHSALNVRLLTCGLFVPVAIEVAFVVLGVVVNPAWFILMGLLPFFVPVMTYTGLLYRNWPTGIRIDEEGIRIGAVGSPRAARRKPTINHQSWGLFTCPWQAAESMRVVTDRAELRELQRSPRYFTFNNRWGGKAAMSHCNIGVLASPFMRAALVIHIDPFGVASPGIRPARYYSNFKNGRFSRLIPPQLSSTWIVPTRHPEALRRALQGVPENRETIT